MLSAQILNSDATLNNFIVLDTKNFIPGEQFTLFVRIIDIEKSDLRYIPAATVIATFTFNKNDGTTFTKVSPADVTILADDRSMMSMVIEESESIDLAGGNFSFQLDLLGDGTQILRGQVQNGLAKNLIDGAC